MNYWKFIINHTFRMSQLLYGKKETIWSKARNDE